MSTMEWKRFIVTDRFLLKLDDLQPEKCMDFRVSSTYDSGCGTVPIAAHVQVKRLSAASRKRADNSVITFEIVIGEKPKHGIYLKTTRVRLYPMPCEYAIEETIEANSDDGIMKIPYAQLRSNALDCGHVILNVKANFSSACEDDFSSSDCVRDYVRTTLGEELKNYGNGLICDDIIPKPPTCSYCGYFGSLPAPPKNQTSDAICYFSGEAFEQDDFATFAIHVGRDEFFVHPVILAHASPIFRDMLTKPSPEAQQGYLEIPLTQANPSLVRSLLEAIYEPSVLDGWTKTFQMVEPLYTLADHYDIVAVKRACEKASRYLHFDPWDICDLLLFAESHNLPNLFRRCCDCDVQRALPRDFWTVGPGKKFKTSHSGAFANYTCVVEKACRCGPPLALGRKRKR